MRPRNASAPWPGALRFLGTSCPSTTGFVRRFPSSPARRIAALMACAAASWVSKKPTWRRLRFASLYFACHRRALLCQLTPQNLDVVSVGARAGSGATTAERSSSGHRADFGTSAPVELV